MPCRLFSQVSEKPNVIFFIIDDLNDYVQGYNGQPQIQTPNILALQQEGVTFTNAICTAPGCAPSRASFFSGKDLAYTQVYNNNDYNGNFRNEFTAEKNNAFVVTLPQILKDSGGYFTYAINKNFHNENENDFDEVTGDLCAKQLSWNDMTFFNEEDWFVEACYEYSFSFNDSLKFGPIPDSLEKYIRDSRSADAAIQFLDDYAAGTTNTCGKPFFLSLGFDKPHINRFIPEKYFPEGYVKDFFEEPFVIPFNYPAGAFPYNGIVMPAQPVIPYDDYFQLPSWSLARKFADATDDYEQMLSYVDDLPYLPEINGITSAEQLFVLQETVRSNYLIAYYAAVQYVDAQIGRVMETLNDHPDLKENTIIVFMSDHGYSLGEKRHWTKWSLWETDIRVPFIIVHPDKEKDKISHRTISTLDLFPTICSLTNTPIPAFDDGQKYIDGTDISSYLSSPLQIIEKPALTTFKKSAGSGSCFPHYSIRNERFHYIQYHTNNNGSGGANYCDEALSLTEEELYDIGTDYETDPYEWNNLGGDERYDIVKKYLGQWCPEGPKYLQKTFTLKIKEDYVSCYYQSNDVLHISSLLYDLNGTELVEIPAGKHLIWWTSESLLPGNILSADIILNDISAIADGEKNELIIYVALYNEDYSVIEAIDLKKINIADTEHLYPAFTVTIIDQTIDISDIIYPLNTVDAKWDYGDGYIYYGLNPPSHSYTGNEIYTLRCSAIISSEDSCYATTDITFHSGVNATISTSDDDNIILNIMPNPAHDILTISLQADAGNYNLDIYNINGAKMYTSIVVDEYKNFRISLPVEHFADGMYIVRISEEKKSAVKSFIKM
ncbi:MAG: sulfatase-like hydrolase/transferase [Chitinophagales bacterium]|nr:sulfatase-like hydrolase/transferase [Chitinophagales bacterium]